MSSNPFQFDRLRNALNSLGPLGKYSLIIFIASRFSDLFMVLYKVILGRFLAPVDFGAIDPFFSVLSILALPLGVLMQAGVKSISRLGAIGEEGQRNGLIRDLGKIVLLLGATMACLILLFKDLLLSRLHLDAEIFIWVMAGIALFDWLNVWIQSALQGCQRFKLVAALAPVSPSIMALTTFVLVAWCSMGLVGAMEARVLTSVLALVAGFWFLKRILAVPRKPYAAEWRTMLGSTWSIAVFSLGTALLMNFDRLFVRNFLLADSGGYGAVITVGQIPLWFVGSITMVLFPMAAGDFAGGKSGNKLLLQSLGMGAAITLGCAGFFAVAARPLMGLWNREFVPYSGLVWAYAVAMGLQGIVLIIGNYEIARHRYRGLWWLTGPALIFCAAIYCLRGSMTIQSVILGMILVRLVIIAGMLWGVFRRASDRPAAG